MKFAFIAKHRGIWPADWLCGALGVWRGGFNAWLTRPRSSLKTERTARKTYRTREEAKADVFDYIERFYNAKLRHSTIGYMSPVEFEMRAGLA